MQEHTFADQHPGRAGVRRLSLVVLLVGALMVALLPAPGTTAALADGHDFPDLSEDNPHRDNVLRLSADGVIRGFGDGTFRPFRAVSRGQFATYLAGVAGLEEASGPYDFPDIEGSVHAGNIQALSDAGLISGFGDGTYRPSASISRAQTASVLAGWLDVEGIAEGPFEDVSADSVHAPNINALYDLGIVNGTTPTTYAPRGMLQRDQAASLVLAASDAAVAQLTIVNSGHLHGKAIDLDWRADEPFPEGEERGVARISTMMNEIREDRGEEQTLLFDTGDTIQRTPFTHYFQVHAPFHETGEMHPMAKVVNHVGWDAWSTGNHEWNYGIDVLDAFADQVEAPMLAANALDVETGEPMYEPYSTHRVEMRGHKPIDVAFLGLTHPESAVWDRHHVAGKVEFLDPVETAQEYVPKLEEQADVVLVGVHAGVDEFGAPLAEQVAGIDIVLAGHTSERSAWIENEETGEDVLVAMKGTDGTWSSIIDLDLTKVRGQWTISDIAHEEVDAGNYEEDAAVVELVEDDVQTVRDWLDTPIGEATEDLPLERSLIEDVAATDWMDIVQQEEVEQALEGSQHEDLPVLSASPPLNTNLGLEEGELLIRDVFGLYNYENNVLKAVKASGEDVIDYLEWSVSFHDTLDHAGPHESIGGLQWYFAPTYPLEIEFDLGQEPGERVAKAAFEGEPIGGDDEFVLATTNYNINGGGGGPLPDLEVVYSEFQHPPDLFVEWVQDNEVIDPADDWRIHNWVHTFEGEPILVE
jgi:2',3'-cyclic-nucleotide 2'-phosphodiesterase / 3'-nucleotidase